MLSNIYSIIIDEYNKYSKDVLRKKKLLFKNVNEKMDKRKLFSNTLNISVEIALYHDTKWLF